MSSIAASANPSERETSLINKDGQFSKISINERNEGLIHKIYSYLNKSDILSVVCLNKSLSQTAISGAYFIARTMISGFLSSIPKSLSIPSDTIESILSGMRKTLDFSKEPENQEKPNLIKLQTIVKDTTKSTVQALASVPGKDLEQSLKKSEPNSFVKDLKHFANSKSKIEEIVNNSTLNDNRKKFRLNEIFTQLDPDTAIILVNLIPYPESKYKVLYEITAKFNRNGNHEKVIEIAESITPQEDPTETIRFEYIDSLLKKGDIKKALSVTSTLTHDVSLLHYLAQLATAFFEKYNSYNEFLEQSGEDLKDLSRSTVITALLQAENPDLSQAEELAKAINDERKKNDELFSIAKAHLDNKNFEKVKDLAPLISNHSDRAALAIYLAVDNEFATAKEIANSLENSEKYRALSTIARELANIAEYDEAIEIAKKLPAESELLYIVNKLLDKSTVEKAIECAKNIKNLNSKGFLEILNKLSEKKIDALKLLEIVESMNGGEEYKCKSYALVTKFLACEGQTTKALDIIDKIKQVENEFSKDPTAFKIVFGERKISPKALSEIAIILAEKKNTEEAIVIAKSIECDFYKTEAFRKIIPNLVFANKIEEAQELAKSTSNEDNKASLYRLINKGRHSLELIDEVKNGEFDFVKTKIQSNPDYYLDLDTTCFYIVDLLLDKNNIDKAKDFANLINNTNLKEFIGIRFKLLESLLEGDYLKEIQLLKQRGDISGVIEKSLELVNSLSDKIKGDTEKKAMLLKQISNHLLSLGQSDTALIVAASIPDSQITEQIKIDALTAIFNTMPN